MESNQLKVAATKYLTTKEHGASGNGSKKSPDQSITGFKMILNHQNLGICADICNIGQDMTQNRIFGNGGSFCPSLPFLDNSVRYPPITGFMLFDIKTCV